MLKKTLILLLTILSIFVCGYFYNLPQIGIDDANIYMVYMRNLAQGNGFVYNVGGEKVEGFTSLLWCLIGAFCYKILPNDAEKALLFLNLVLICHTVMRLSVFLQKINEEKRLFSPVLVFFIGALLIIPGFYDWNVWALLETGLWTWIISNIVILLAEPEKSKNEILLSLLFVIALITRPESLLFVPFCIFIRFFQIKRTHTSFFYSLKKIILLIVTFILTTSTLIFWRLYYFGFPFPNTYYAKVSTDKMANALDGLHYLNLYFGFTSPFGMIIFILICLYIVYHYLGNKKGGNHSTSAQIHLLLASICLVFFAIPLYTGGDHFGLSRMYQPIVPILYVFFLHKKGWESLFPSFIEKLNVYFFDNYIVIGISVILLYFTPNKKLHQMGKEASPLHYEFWFAEKGREQGNELNDIFENASHPSIGVITAGGIAYTYKGEIIDLMGLNLTKMAHAVKEKKGPKNHAAFDKKTFYEIEPDIFWYHSNAFQMQDTIHFVLDENTEKHSQDFMFRACKGIVYDSIFRKTYVPVFIAKKQKKLILQTYISYSFLQKIDTNIYSIIPIKRIL